MPEQKSFGAIPTAKQFNQINFNTMKNSAEQITNCETQERQDKDQFSSVEKAEFINLLSKFRNEIIGKTRVGTFNALLNIIEKEIVNLEK